VPKNEATTFPATKPFGTGLKGGVPTTRGGSVMRKLVGAVVVLAFCFSVAVAEDIKGKITKIDDQKVTIMVKDAEKSYPLAKDVKLLMGKEPLAGGLKASVFQKLDPKKGVAATVVVTDNKVTEIRVQKKKE
jgi:hypothetical protein